jgi:NAD(P)H dehydrogenase (quinone)
MERRERPVIVVTGAAGHVGGIVARELSRRGVSARLLVRDASRAPDLPGADVVVADYGDTDSLTRALNPADRVFMVSVHEDYDRRVTLHRSFVEAAARRRVARVIYLSFVGAGSDARFRHARSHGATEAMLADAGLPFTSVWNSMYADGIASWFDEEGRITGPGGTGRVSLSLRSEIGEAIAVLLADDSHDDLHRVTITGPEALTLDELAGIASSVTGDLYRYEPLDREAWIAYRRRLGRPEWAIDAGISYYDGVAAGEAAIVSDDFHELTGRFPKKMAQVIECRRAEMPLTRGEQREPAT